MFEEENSDNSNDLEQDKLASLAYSVFVMNPSGKELLEKLKEKYLLAPVCLHNQSPNYGYYREGENQMIRNFYILIQKH